MGIADDQVESKVEKSLSQVFSKGTRASRPEVAVTFFQFKTTYGDVENEFLGGEERRVLVKVIYVLVSWSPATADH